MPSVSVISVTRTKNNVGDATRETVETVHPYGWPWAGGFCLGLGTSSEGDGSRGPAVVTKTTFYGPAGAAPDADDLIVLFDHSSAMDGEWQVDGDVIEYVHPNGWKPGFEVAVKRAGSS